MNAERRKHISSITEQLESLKETLEAIASEIEDVYNEEDECYNNLPEGLQQSQRGYAMEDAISNLGDADSTASGMVDTIDEIISYLEDAAQ